MKRERPAHVDFSPTESFEKEVKSKATSLRRCNYKKRRTEMHDAISEAVAKKDKLIRSAIKENDLDCVLFALKAPSWIVEHYLRTTNYYVFDWAMTIGSLSVLEVLLNGVRPEHHLMMLGHDGYKAVKNFMRNLLRYETVQNSERVQCLLAFVKQLASIDPEVKEKMQVVIQEEKQLDAIYDFDMMKLLQHTFQSIFPVQKKSHDSPSIHQKVRFFSQPVDSKEFSNNKNETTNNPPHLA